MLTFFATLLVNILIGTIFYLVISLRLEKSSSELHVKKMRREMDEMLREFNITAERNISLLENRIEAMKRLLERHGINSDINHTVDSDNGSTKSSISDRSDLSLKTDSIEKAETEPESSGLLKKLSNRIMNAIHETSAIKEKGEFASKRKPKTPYGESLDIRVDGSSDSVKEVKPGAVRHPADMKTAFVLAGSRKEIYGLLSQYYDEGHSVEELSRVSGVPIGEISLVVSLNSRRG